jgi:hypothetical protein
MQFLYPAFLWALTGLSIPIILHLFYFRRYKKVYFSNLRFLREVKEETSARNRLRNLLILLARLLAMAFIILAFAQPYIPAKNAEEAGIRNVSMFVDNSFSMQSFGQDLSLFDRSRQKAKEIILGYDQEDRFQILNHDLSPGQNIWVGRDEALLRLEEMEYSPAVKPLSVITGRQQQGFSREDGIPVAWIISDFQQSIVDIESFDTTFQTNLLPLRSVQEKNIAIDSAWFESPIQVLNQNSVLLFSLHNYSPEDATNIRVSVSLDGQERPEGSLDIAGNQVRIDTANITVLQSGWHEVAIRITDFPVTFDDTYYLSFFVSSNLRILSIDGQQPNASINAVFANPRDFVHDHASANNLQYAALNEYDLIILNELTLIPSGLASAMQSYAQAGGKVLFLPSATGSVEQYNNLMRTMNARELTPYRAQERQVGTINTDAFVYRDVFSRKRPNMRLPKVNASFPTSGAGSRGQSLLTFRDGGDLVTFYPTGKGAFAVVTAPLDQSVSDFSLQPEVFVPLLYKMAVYSSDARQLAYTIGKDHLVPLDKANLTLDKDFRITGPVEFIPGVTPLGNRLLVDVQGQIREAGFYTIDQENQKIASLAFNYDRRESDLRIMEPEDLPESDRITLWVDEDKVDFTQLIRDTQQGKPLWKWCIIMALLFIAFEIALIRLWKNG